MSNVSSMGKNQVLLDPNSAEDRIKSGNPGRKSVSFLIYLEKLAQAHVITEV